MTKLTKRVLATGVAASIALPFAAMAQVSFLNETDAGSLGLATGETDLYAGISKIVAYILQFLGLIAVIIILYGGFIWMTSAGNEEKVSKAKSTITAGLIGLIIIILAWAISTFVIGAVTDSLAG